MIVISGETPMNAQISSPDQQPEMVSILLFGILLMGLGVLAIASPFVASLTTEVYIGSLFVLSGVIHTIYAFKTQTKGQFIQKVLFSLLYLSTGLILLAYPLQGVISLTLVIASFIFSSSATQIVQAFQTRPTPGWEWILISGISGLVLASLIFLQWPSNALWIIGLLVGMNLITDGSAIIGLSLAQRKMSRELPPTPQQT